MSCSKNIEISKKQELKMNSMANMKISQVLILRLENGYQSSHFSKIQQFLIRSCKIQGRPGSFTSQFSVSESSWHKFYCFFQVILNIHITSRVYIIL